MKLIFFTILFILISALPIHAASKKVVVGNPNSRNNIQINQFYVISRPYYSNYSSQTIMTHPNNERYGRYRPNQNNLFNNN